MVELIVAFTILSLLAAMAVPMRAKDGRSPLISAEHSLKPWVVLAIMPIFAVLPSPLAQRGDRLVFLVRGVEHALKHLVLFVLIGGSHDQPTTRLTGKCRPC